MKQLLVLCLLLSSLAPRLLAEGPPRPPTPKEEVKEPPKLSTGERIEIPDVGFSITPPNGWMVHRNSHGSSLLFEAPKQPNQTYLPVIQVMVFGKPRYVDEVTQKEYGDLIVEKFGKLSNRVTGYHLRSAEFVQMETGDPAILYYTEFQYDDIPIMQMHILISSAANHFLMSYTDVAKVFDDNGSPGLGIAYSSMHSAQLESQPPWRWRGFVIAGIAVFMALFAWFTMRFMRARKLSRLGQRIEEEDSKEITEDEESQYYSKHTTTTTGTHAGDDEWSDGKASSKGKGAPPRKPEAKVSHVQSSHFDDDDEDGPEVSEVVPISMLEKSLHPGRKRRENTVVSSRQPAPPSVQKQPMSQPPQSFQGQPLSQPPQSMSGQPISQHPQYAQQPPMQNMNHQGQPGQVIPPQPYAQSPGQPIQQQPYAQPPVQHPGQPAQQYAQTSVQHPGQPVQQQHPGQPAQQYAQTPVQHPGQPAQQYAQPPVQHPGQPAQQYAQPPVQHPGQPAQQYAQPPVQNQGQPVPPQQYPQPPIVHQGVQQSYSQPPAQHQGQPVPSQPYAQPPVQNQGQSMPQQGQPNTQQYAQPGQANHPQYAQEQPYAQQSGQQQGSQQQGQPGSQQQGFQQQGSQQQGHPDSQQQGFQQQPGSQQGQPHSQQPFAPSAPQPMSPQPPAQPMQQQTAPAPQPRAPQPPAPQQSMQAPVTAPPVQQSQPLHFAQNQMSNSQASYQTPAHEAMAHAAQMGQTHGGFEPSQPPVPISNQPVYAPQGQAPAAPAQAYAQTPAPVAQTYAPPPQPAPAPVMPQFAPSEPAPEQPVTANRQPLSTAKRQQQPRSQEIDEDGPEMTEEARLSEILPRAGTIEKSKPKRKGLFWRKKSDDDDHDDDSDDSGDDKGSWKSEGTKKSGLRKAKGEDEDEGDSGDQWAVEPTKKSTPGRLVEKEEKEEKDEEEVAESDAWAPEPTKRSEPKKDSLLNETQGPRRLVGRPPQGPVTKENNAAVTEDGWNLNQEVASDHDEEDEEEVS